MQAAPPEPRRLGHENGHSRAHSGWKLARERAYTKCASSHSHTTRPPDSLFCLVEAPTVLALEEERKKERKGKKIKKLTEKKQWTLNYRNLF